MTAYSKEFEKWLNSSHDKAHDDDEDEDEEENKVKDCQSPKEDNVGCTGDSVEDDSSQSSFADFSKDPTSVHFNQSAPILIDDDDVDEDMFSYSHFEDEPPILEPVPKMAGNRTPSAHSPKLTHQESLRSYSRIKHSYSRQRSLQESDMKTYSGKSNFHHTLSDDYEKRHVKSINAKNSKETGNIFDKFLSESYDSPPPLIPSPEALKLQCESQVGECKHPGHSPDFCAMEADSTSEITCGKETCTPLGSSQVKNSADVLIECDSTCMFGASPAFVSPASVSCGDSEEMTGADFIECSQERNILDQDLDSPELCSSHSGDKMISDRLPPTHQEVLTPEVVLQTDLQSDCVCEKTDMHVDESQLKAFRDTSEKNISVNDEPPTLAIMPPLPLSRIGSRLKRHTIDSPETYSRTYKQHDSECPTALDCPAIPSSPPILTCISQNDTYSKQQRRSTKTSRKNCFSKMQDDTDRKKRRRHCSVPLTDQSMSMSDSVHSFITYTCLLSRLKTQMHTLLMHIFPQIRPDMKNLSPESPLLVNILSDLFWILQQPEEGSHAVVSRAKKNQPHKASGVLSSSGATDIKSCHSLMTIGSHLLTTSASSSSHIACDISSQKQPSNGEEHLDNELTISKLSSLSLKEQKDGVKPLVILLTKDPQAELKQFCHLSCGVVQLLLPDLTINLCDELANSPADLLVFLDNVIMLNAKSKIKTYHW